MDTLSFEQIYKAYRETIIRYLETQYRHTHHDAEELADDVFLTLYDKWNTLDIQRSKLLTYLYRTARYKSLNFYKKKHRKLPTISLEEVLTADPEHITLQDIGIDMGKDAPEYQETLKKIKSLLTEKEKQIFEYAFEKEYKMSKIARLMEIKEESVRVHCFNIRQKCKENKNKILKC